MKKSQIVLLALGAVFAFSAMLASTAFGEVTLLAEWLIDGTTKVTTTLATEATGSLTLRDTEAPIVGNAAVLCTALTKGTISEDGLDTTDEILNLDGVATGGAVLGGEPLLGTGAASGLGSECVAVEGCSPGTATSPIEVWPIGLPWLTLLFLMADGKILDLITSDSTAKLVGYELLCLVFGINAEDTCTAEDFEIEILNDAEGNAEIPTGAETTPRATCTASGNKPSGQNIVDELSNILITGKLLAVSSE